MILQSRNRIGRIETEAQINPHNLYLRMTHTSEILGVGFVNVRPVLAIVDAVEVPGCGEKSTETSRRYLRHLILVLRPLFPNMDLCVGFQLHVYTYTRLYNTQMDTHQPRQFLQDYI